MNGETRIILDKIDEHAKTTREKLGEHGELLATLVERSKNAKERLDRVEKKATVISAITGAVSGVGVVLAKTFGFDA